MKRIVDKFILEGEYVSSKPYGNGHINDTYIISYNKKGKLKYYILQRINHYVFKNVDQLMDNFVRVTDYIYKKLILDDRNPYRGVLNVIPTKDGKYYCYDVETDKYYRLLTYIENSTSLEVVDNAEVFERVGKAFGDFQNLLKDFDITNLYETIPNFHNTKVRYQNFINALNTNEFDRAKTCKEEIDFVTSRKELCNTIVDLIEEKKIPLRVTHNDTKANNILIDKDTLETLCVVDLDTIMPGSILYDFADSIRFGCNTANEDEQDLSKVKFSIENFEAYTKGFLGETKDNMNSFEKANIINACKIITLECGMRFLTDYLENDKYFKIHRENHNLDRCRTQFKLVLEMEKYTDILESIVNKYL